MCFDIAMSIAAADNVGKFDKGGKPYVLHLIRVAMRLRTSDLNLMALAVLHDTVEDGYRTFDELLKLGIDPTVVNDLKYLTHQRGISYEEYIENMRGRKNVLLVKREDLRDNSDISRLKGVEPKDHARMAKYHKAFLRVEEMLAEIENNPRILED